MSSEPSRHVACLLITGGGRFPQILDLFSVPSGCLWETSIFKIMIDDGTLWSKLESIHVKFTGFY